MHLGVMAVNGTAVQQRYTVADRAPCTGGVRTGAVILLASVVTVTMLGGGIALSRLSRFPG